MIFLTTSSDGFGECGIGSICQWHILLSCLAKEMNVGLSVKPYENIAHNYFSLNNWNSSFTEFFNFPYEKKIDYEIDFNESYESLKSYIDLNRNTSEKVLINLSFEFLKEIQYMVSLFDDKGYFEEIRKNILYSNRSYFSKDVINVAFHLRAANPEDIQSELSYSPREIVNISDNFYRYKNVLNFIKNKHDNEKIDLHIYSQGKLNDYCNFYELSSESFKIFLHLDENPKDDIYHMSNSDYLIMSNSSYSWLCHLLNSNITFVRNNFWHTVKKNSIFLDYNYCVI